MMKKIALVARNLPPLYGGGGMLARSLAINLQKRGYKVDVLTDTPAPEPIGNCRVASPYEKKQSAHPLSRMLRRFNEYRWLRRQISKGSYDVVYAVSAQPFTLSAVHAAKCQGIPTSFETSLLGNDDYLTICKTRLGALWKRFFLSADKIVNISPPLENACLEGGIPKDMLAMIPNPVNQEKFYPVSSEERNKLRSEYGLTNAETILFSAGAISYRKGLDRLISAFLEIAHREPLTILALAGPIPDDHPSSQFANGLKSAIAKAGLTDRVLWLGRINNVNEWMQLSDIFVFASRREGFGTVFTEAMAIGVPIVAYSISGITDFIFNQESAAFIVDSKEEFVDAVLSLVNDEELREEYGDSLCLQYDNRFSLKLIMDLYEKLFQTITKH